MVSPLSLHDSQCQGHTLNLFLHCLGPCMIPALKTSVVINWVGPLACPHTWFANHRYQGSHHPKVSHNPLLF